MSYFLIKPKEAGLVFWSFIYFLSLLSGYFILRPLRDEMGILNGANNMQWLFTGTFLTMLLVVPLFGYVTKKYSIKRVLTISYVFFIVNLILFYVAFNILGKSNVLAVIFFIWLSVFNLFVVSLFWSFMADVYSSEASKRLFGVIAAGGSIGALVGPVMSSYLINNSEMDNLLLVSMFFLLVSIFSIEKISNLKMGKSKSGNHKMFNPNILLKANFRKSLLKSLKSKYLLGIIIFIIIYTSVSTILYFQQAHILEETVSNSKDRIIYFSRVDLITNGLAIIGQFFFTSRIIKKFGLALALCGVPLLLGVGFLLMSYKLSLLLIAILIIIHRAGNFSLLKPSREMLFTVCTKDEKYRAKNFIDTVVYRGGDAFTGWVFTLFISLGFGLSVIAILAVPLVILWSFVGYKLGKQQLVKENNLILKNDIL